MRTRRYSYMVTHGLLVSAGLILTLLVAKPSSLWTTLFVAVGTSLAATGVAGWTMWLYVRAQEKSVASAKSIDKAGIEYVYSKRAAQIHNEYDLRLRRAKHVDIMGFGLRQFNLDYMKKLGDIKKHATIRILIINPDSPHALARDIEEKQSEGTIKREAEEFITQFSELYPHNTGKLQLRIYDCLPMVNIFRVGRDLFWGPYLLDRNSGNTFTIRASRHGVIYSQLKAHFEGTWNAARTPVLLTPSSPEPPNQPPVTASATAALEAGLPAPSDPLTDPVPPNQ